MSVRFSRVSLPSAIATPISHITKGSDRASTVPRMRSPVLDLFADLSGALDALGLEWYLFGAQAAILYGAARLTADVDVTVRLLPPMSTEALVAALGSAGFTSRFSDPAFIQQTRVIPLVHASTSMPLDVVLAGPGIEDHFIKRVRTRDLDGTFVRVASPEDLIVMKVLAGRPKDADDVLAILEAQAGQLDLPYIRQVLRALEDSLGQSDLCPGFERALARIGEAE